MQRSMARTWRLVTTLFYDIKRICHTCLKKFTQRVKAIMNERYVQMYNFGLD